MANPKEILVITTSSFDGLTIKQYLKPISAHIVAGTNLFSDFFASFTDVFGGRSQTYQRQLSSLYAEAIERLKIAAYEIGANCIVGLKVDLDEISGKGKSMFMITAIGTAVMIEDNLDKRTKAKTYEKVEIIGLDKLRALQEKREIIGNADENALELDDETWDFITRNQVYEVLDFILEKLKSLMPNPNDTSGISEEFYKKLLSYIDALPEDKKNQLLYDNVANNQSEQVRTKLYEIIEDLQLLNLDQIIEILDNTEFEKQKKALKILNSDKPFYNKIDLEKLSTLRNSIEKKFPERGKRSTKKQFLSSKEKEVWVCECGNTVELDKYCGGCKRDIYGFTSHEMSPPRAIEAIDEKIDLITEFIPL
jgi:uncharacterized protein YbjQ (UPF0145 family)